ncbi:MAG: RluA family pseudouridine synthase [Pyramidobacter sp.]|nr:RluA family pseudouridine synthase [Pyramidobacter sp.]
MEDTNLYEVAVPDEEDGTRLDLFLAGELSLSRSRIQSLIERGAVSSSCGKIRPSLKVRPGQTFRLTLPEATPSAVEPQNVPFSTVYEDSDIIVLNKPAGVVVHPGAGRRDGTLVNGLMFRYPEIGRIGDSVRPGIVHRLDVGTSGLMVVARSDQAFKGLLEAFQNRDVLKEYIALGIGSLKAPSGTVNAPIGRDPHNRLKMCVIWDGREAVTDYKVLWTRARYNLILLRLHSGRTHQIRVHMRAIGCSLDGDTLYGPKDPSQHILKNRVFLHSWHLGFTHPVSGAFMEFKAPLPPELIHALQGPLSIPPKQPERSGDVYR